MATVIALISETPEPQQGENACLILMTFEQGKGYRLSASAAPSGRVIGRWISDCPLSVAQSALLWVSTQQWQVQLAQGSLDVNQVLDQVPRPTPMHTPGVHPLEVIELLSKNLPPRHPTNPATGATVMIRPEPASSSLGGIGPRPHVHVPSAPSEQPLLAPPTSSPHGAIAQQPSEHEPNAARELALFLRDHIQALREGHDPERVRQGLVASLGYSVDEEDFSAPEGEEEDFLEDEIDLDVLLAEHGIDPDAVAVPAPAPAPQPQAQIPSHLPPLPEGVRPLQPGEELPNLTPEQRLMFEKMGDDGRAREKLERTNERAMKQRESILRNMAAVGVDPNRPWEEQYAEQEARYARLRAERGEPDPVPQLPANQVMTEASPVPVPVPVEVDAPHEPGNGQSGRAMYLSPQEIADLKAGQRAREARQAVEHQAAEAERHRQEAEVERLRQEAEVGRLRHEAAEAERRRQEAAEAERHQQQAAEDERRRQEAAERQRQEAAAQKLRQAAEAEAQRVLERSAEVRREQTSAPSVDLTRMDPTPPHEVPKTVREAEPPPAPKPEAMTIGPIRVGPPPRRS